MGQRTLAALTKIAVLFILSKNSLSTSPTVCMFMSQSTTKTSAPLASSSTSTRLTVTPKVTGEVRIDV